MTNLKTIEITTNVGCSNMCKYCPQTLFINQYSKRSKEYILTFDTYKKCLSKIPKDTKIVFSGMSEPWLNKNCTEMILYTYKKGYKKISVFTTCVGMTMEDFNDILIGIRDNKTVYIPYQLIRHNQLNKIIDVLGGSSEACDYFMKVLEAEPATFKENL